MLTAAIGGLSDVHAIVAAQHGLLQFYAAGLIGRQATELAALEAIAAHR
jgi:hypothetical protein